MKWKCLTGDEEGVLGWGLFKHRGVLFLENVTGNVILIYFPAKYSRNKFLKAFIYLSVTVPMIESITAL